MMKKLFAAVVVCAASGTVAAETDQFTFDASFRYRVEHVDQQGLSEEALASSLKTRLTLRAPVYDRLSAAIEIDNVSYIGQDQFNSTRNENRTYPVIADPEGTDINRAVISYDGDRFDADLGRQRIVVGNQRHVGGVAWRQNEQTFDAVTFSGRVSETDIRYSYIDGVSRIFGPEEGFPARSFDSNSHLVVVDRKTSPIGKIHGYALLLDLENAQSLSTATVGARVERRIETDDWVFPLAAEFALQRDYGDNALDFRNHYGLISVGAIRGALGFSLNVEKLSSDNGVGYSTPLATLHKFQGWADRFLVTPSTGIVDRYATVSARFGDARIALTAHRFDADEGGDHYGDELDVSLTYKLSKHASLLLKLAHYNADEYSTDTTKAWAMVTVSL